MAHKLRDITICEQIEIYHHFDNEISLILKFGKHRTALNTSFFHAQFDRENEVFRYKGLSVLILRFKISPQYFLHTSEILRILDDFLL